MCVFAVINVEWKEKWCINRTERKKGSHCDSLLRSNIINCNEKNKNKTKILRWKNSISILSLILLHIFQFGCVAIFYFFYFGGNKIYAHALIETAKKRNELYFRKSSMLIIGNDYLEKNGYQWKKVTNLRHLIQPIPKKNISEKSFRCKIICK